MATLSALVAGAALAAEEGGTGFLGTFGEFGDLVDAVELVVLQLLVVIYGRSMGGEAYAKNPVGFGLASVNGVVALRGGIGVFGSARHNGCMWW